MRRPALLLAAIGVVAVVFLVTCGGPTPPQEEPFWTPTSHAIQQALLEGFKTVSLKNCTFKRVGSANDGGYLMCENLMKDVKAAYSYGIDLEDNWGCEVSKEGRSDLHQYDCFTTARPTCGSRFEFHEECMGPRREPRRSAVRHVAGQIARIATRRPRS